MPGPLCEGRPRELQQRSQQCRRDVGDGWAGRLRRVEANAVCRSRGAGATQIPCGIGDGWASRLSHGRSHRIPSPSHMESTGRHCAMSSTTAEPTRKFTAVAAHTSSNCVALEFTRLFGQPLRRIDAIYGHVLPRALIRRNLQALPASPQRFSSQGIPQTSRGEPSAVLD